MVYPSNFNDFVEPLQKFARLREVSPKRLVTTSLKVVKYDRLFDIKTRFVT